MGRRSKKSSKIRTLNTVQELGAVRFGHRFPRHGLKLLHWLANNMVEFNNVWMMWAKQNPENGDFGFHRFHNSERILPDPPSQSSYFEVGNLHTAGARSLLFGEDQSWNSESNTDRIILSLDSRMQIGRVYITEHTPHKSQFSAKDTYLLSNNLIWSIKGESLVDFLRQAGYDPGETVPNERDLNGSVSIPILEESSATRSEDEEEDTHVLLPKHPRRRSRNISNNPEDCNCCCCIIL